MKGLQTSLHAGGVLLTILFCFAPASVRAQKKLDWQYTGSVSATLIANPNVTADVYSVEAVEGERLVFNTTLTDIDTTIRVVGPDAAINIFNDDRNGQDLTSNIAFVAPRSGTYLVIVSSYRGEGSGGDYALNFERRPCDGDECNDVRRSRDKHKSHAP